MHRCLVSLADWESTELQLPPEEAHHLANVMRIGIGERVVICDGMGGEGEAIVRRVARDGVMVELVPGSVRRHMPASRLWLFQALPKGKRMDVAVEKAAELGVTDVVPIRTERVIVRLDASQARHKVARWQRIAEGASKQCRSPWVPRVHGVAALAEALAGLGDGVLTIVGALAVNARPLHEVVVEQAAALSGDVALFIGPEGDFTPAELQSICNAGALPVSLGPRVLRTETAAIYGLSVISAARDAAGQSVDPRKSSWTTSTGRLGRKIRAKD